MKKFYLILYILIQLHTLIGFDFEEFDSYQHQLSYEEVKRKIKTYLEKDSEIYPFYRLTQEALYLGEYVLYLNDAAGFAFQKEARSGLEGVKIALDPGHLGGEFAEIEERFIKVPAEKTQEGKEIFFAEGDLTYLTALELKRLLEEAGATVFVTRTEKGKGVLEEDFFTWMKRAPCSLKRENFSKIFRTYYNNEDLRKRAELINHFSPDITLIIHYNGHLSAAEKEAKALITEANYNLAFIPGAFCKEELKTKEDLYEFLRLLVTDTIEESLYLSRAIVRAFVRTLQVPLLTEQDSPSYIERACLKQEEGIYCRNLALTRLIHSPLCYGETLIQNNEEEMYRLATQDALIMGMPCSKRIQEVAQAYFEGIKEYFNHKN